MAKLEEAIEMINGLTNDTSIPRNIRKALGDAKQKLMSSDELSVKVSAAIYIIESVSDDINMPAHARTQIWALISALEAIKPKE